MNIKTSFALICLVSTSISHGLSMDNHPFVSIKKEEGSYRTSILTIDDLQGNNSKLSNINPFNEIMGKTPDKNCLATAAQFISWIKSNNIFPAGAPSDAPMADNMEEVGKRIRCGNQWVADTMSLINENDIENILAPYKEIFDVDDNMYEIPEDKFTASFISKSKKDIKSYLDTLSLHNRPGVNGKCSVGMIYADCKNQKNNERIGHLFNFYIYDLLNGEGKVFLIVDPQINMCWTLDNYLKKNTTLSYPFYIKACASVQRHISPEHYLQLKQEDNSKNVAKNKSDTNGLFITNKRKSPPLNNPVVFNRSAA